MTRTVQFFCLNGFQVAPFPTDASMRCNGRVLNAVRPKKEKEYQLERLT